MAQAANQAPNAPLKFSQILQLPRLGINAQNIKFTNVTMESDRCIVVREDQKISIVSIAKKNVTPLKVTVDSAIMNPTSNVLGLRAKTNDGKTNLQIFNLDMQAKMKQFESSDPILYWRWLDAKTIAFVTSKAAYHWSMENNVDPEKKFDIVAEERQVQIINYDSSVDGQWLFLQGIAKNAETNEIEGVLQLYSVEAKKYQPKMNAHGGCFAHITLDGRENPCTLFAFTRKDGQSTKLFIVEVGNQDKNAALRIQTEVNFQKQGDFIVCMVPSVKYSCLYAISQSGSFFLFDIHTGKCMFSKATGNNMFLASAHDESGGILTVDRNGNVCLFAVDPDTYVPYVTKVLGDVENGVKIARRSDLGGVNDIFANKFDQLIAQGNYEAAAKLAAEAPQGVLRTNETIRKFQAAPIQANKPPPDLAYYQLLLQKGPLNREESIALCSRILSFKPGPGKQKIEKFLKENKLENSEELGDLLARHDPKLACSVYYRAKVPQKTILCFIQLGQSDKIVQYARSENYNPNWSELLGHVQQMKRDDVKSFASSLV